MARKRYNEEEELARVRRRPAPSNSYEVVVTAKSGLNRRCKPGFTDSCKIVDVLSYGARVTVDSERMLNGSIWGHTEGGWINLEYVEKVGG